VLESDINEVTSPFIISLWFYMCVCVYVFCSYIYVDMKIRMHQETFD
jgi:uncharacterized BrkB/YihY/UPF0761 family membrane protein